MPTWVDQVVNDYAKRLPSDWLFQLKEVKAEPRVGGKSTLQLKAAEAARIRKALPERAVVIVLDEQGDRITSVDLADRLQAWRVEQTPSICFLIGGPDGLDDSLKKTAQAQYRLSDLTLPHGLVRVLLVEQLYRAWSLMQGHPYHRA